MTASQASPLDPHGKEAISARLACDAADTVRAMKAKLGHVGINLPEESFPFLKDLLRHLGLSFDLDDGTHLHFGDGHTYLCITATKAEYLTSPHHRKHTGLSHLAFDVSSPTDVDKFVSGFLTPRGIVALYGGAQSPPGYPETYYAVYFEDSNRIKFEIVSEGTQ